jgi:SAM-dependent methyltransferase
MTGSHVRKNRRDWDRTSDEYQREHARQLNRFDRPSWGVWGLPESRLKILGDVRGKDVLEYGCGGGQWSCCLARLGARPVGLDLSMRQLTHARRLMGRAGVRFPLVNADAERVPFADESFDVVFCDHGAMTFADPYSTVPEVARLLRPGGLFAFNVESALHFICWDDERERVGERLFLDYFGMRMWDDGASVNFMLPHGDWIRLFRANGLELEDLVELRPSARAGTTYPEYVDRGWARRWPAENIWKTRKRG